MNIELQLLIGALGLGTAALILSLLMLLRIRNQQLQLELDAEKIELLEETLAEDQENLQESRKEFSDYSRRIAWLEAKVRRSRYVSVSAHNTVQKTKAPKSNIDEQKNRVMTLAARGQDPATIASTLGMMPGEVELMLSLHSHVTSLA